VERRAGAKGNTHRQSTRLASSSSIVGIATIPQCPRSPRNQPRNTRINIAASRRSVFARLRSRDTATLAEWIMRLDPASNEPARQPEAVAASLIGQRDPADRPPSAHRLVPPPLDQSQQSRRIRLQLLQRLALDAGNSAAHKPARLAHLDDHHQGRDRIKRGQASAEIIDLGHGATSISSYGR
jgi:hypothetical protein